MKHLRGRNALVTGASRGLGLYIALALARNGVHLALVARTADELDRVAERARRFGVRAAPIVADVASAKQRAVALDRADAEIGPVDVLVNNAGVEYAGDFADAAPEDIERLIAVDLVAPMLLTRLVLPGMVARGRGHVANIASLAGKSAMPYDAAYSAAKAGLVAFTAALRSECEGKGVGFSAVCPGFVTDAGMFARWQERGVTAPRLLGTTTPERVADAVVKAILHDSPELLVSGLPLRPLLALGQLFPALDTPLKHLFGITTMLTQLDETET